MIYGMSMSDHVLLLEDHRHVFFTENYFNIVSFHLEIILCRSQNFICMYVGVALHLAHILLGVQAGVVLARIRIYETRTLNSNLKQVIFSCETRMNVLLSRLYILLNNSITVTTFKINTCGSTKASNARKKA